MIQVENISFGYRRGKKEVLHDFSASLEQGKVYGLLKPHFVDACGYPVSVFPMQVTFFSREKGGDMTNLCFQFRENDVVMTWDEKGNPGQRAVLPFNGEIAHSQIKIGELDFDCAGYAFWADAHTLEVHIKPIPATVTRRFIFTFHGNRISMQPRTVPDMEERTKATGEKLKSCPFIFTGIMLIFFLEAYISIRL